ncbi:MAG: hypothetical protein J7647_13675 [Cyanobacteria bacterium SBLK]|nr:hypothetical protein [Cyanobacteria bacterium SBLK]
MTGNRAIESRFYRIVSLLEGALSKNFIASIFFRTYTEVLTRRECLNYFTVAAWIPIN